MQKCSGLITLLTDFGQQDGYVGAMKGVMLGLHPAAKLIDLSHEVAPQNVYAGAFLLQLTQPQYWRETISSTFHGRDIFAPVAAHLAAGVPLNNLGETTVLQRKLPPQMCRMVGITLRGEVVYCDRFGNLISNISRQALQEFADGQSVTIYLAGHLIGGLSQTYAEAPPHSPLALIGSFDFLEIGINLGSAQRHFAARQATPITIARGQII